ncbi:MAG: hypothetical protein U9O49_00155 [Candidatus Thermoplasmatota archaeon]|nr:hypothetical protein [Candidatus Thermoplasmatota archaeon]
MGINKKIAQIRFPILFGILLVFILTSFLSTYFFQEDWSALEESQPIDYAFARFFADAFGTKENVYFLVAIPIMLLLIFGAIKLGGWGIRRIDKETEINGDNHVAMMIILGLLPNFMYIIGWLLFKVRVVNRSLFIVALVLIVIYIIITEIDDKTQKKKLKK